MKQLKITQKITNRNESKAFSKYLADIRQIKPFENADEEYQCALKVSNGDKKAFNELINRNLKFVISVAKQYTGSKYLLEDLVTEGNYGLIEAAKRFEPSRGFKFISYAVWYIRKNVMDYINTKHSQIRLPINKVGNLNRIKMEVNKLEQVHQRTVFNSDLLFSDNLDLNLDEINTLLRIDSFNIASLDAPMSSSEDSSSMIDVISNDNCDSTDHLVNKADFKNLMKSAMSTLSLKQKMVINLTYGLDGQEPLNLIEIGERVEMSREGVRKLRDKSLNLLKINMVRQGIKLDMFSN
jgi:RNA polymerase primary sigma factor